MEVVVKNVVAKRVKVIPRKVEIKTAEVLTKKRVCAYARVSTDSEEQATSYTAQVDYYTNFIKQNPNWIYVDTYADEGISGTSTKRRDGFNRMIKDAMAGKIDLIITKSISRFARNTVDALTNIRKLKDKGVGVFFEKENIDSLDGKGEVMLSILSSLSQEESRSISQNTSWGIRKKFADGKIRMTTTNFLGYDMVDGKLVLNSEQAKTVKLIFKLFLLGYSYYRISKKLEEDGIKTPTGSKRWHMSTIKSVLTNEKYKGDCLLQKGYTSDFLTKKRKTNNGELPQYYIEDDHERIIDKETFDAVQVMAERRGINYSGIDIFSNKIICADCGSSFGRKVWHSNDKYRRVVYRCNNKFKSDRVGKSGTIMSTSTEKCHSMTVDEEMIKNVFVEKYNQINRKEYLKNAENIIKTLDKKDENIDILREKIENIVDEINDLADKNASVKLDQYEYRKKHEKLVKTYEKLKVELENKENEQIIREDKVKEIRIYIDTLKKSGINKEFNRELFAILVDKVIVSENEIKIRWRDGVEI